MDPKKISIFALIFLLLAFIFIYFYGLSSRSNNPIRIKEDINNDGQVDIVDITMVARAFGSKPGDQNWNQDADINKDGKVDDLDMYMVEDMFKKVTG